MSKEHEVFESLTRGIFSETELVSIEARAQVNPYSVEFVQPGRIELLELLDSVVDGLLTLRVGEQEHELQRRIYNEFANNLQADFKLHPGEEVMIKGARSYIGNDYVEPLDGGLEIFGNFLALDVAPWYNVPFSGEISERIEDYEESDGLHVCMAGATLAFPDGSVGILGNITVPLNHGHPDLCRIIRPSEPTDATWLD